MAVGLVILGVVQVQGPDDRQPFRTTSNANSNTAHGQVRVAPTHRSWCAILRAHIARLEITGARWGLAGAEAILRLRAVISNGDLDRYWTYHLDREHHRARQAPHQDAYAITA